MKKLLLIFLFALGFTATASAAKFRIPVCSDCEYIEHVLDLPDSADFFSEEYQQYVDVAYYYKQFWVLGIPIWNYDEQYILHIKDLDVYFEVAEQDLAQYQEQYQLASVGNPISLWNKMGGKVILLLIAGLVIWGYMPAKEKESESVSKEEFFGK